MLKRFYQKIFIAILREEDAHEVTVIGIKNKELLYKEHKRFDGGDPSNPFFAYIQKFIELSPLHYIALLNPEPNQGAMEGCTLHDIDEEGEGGGAKMLCRNKKWMLYASLRELENSQKRYRRVGLDFIFSPFSVIEHFFSDKIGGDFALYALAQKDALSLAFFDKGRLEYAHHFSMSLPVATEEDANTVSFSFDSIHEDEEEERGGIRLDDIESLDDLDIIDDLDDLSDIADLDALEEIAEFSEDTPTFEEQRGRDSHGKELKEQMDRFNDDYRQFELIQKTLSRFYGGEHCRGRFVETVYIADAYGSGSDLKRYLEEELFLNVIIRKLDLADEVLALSQIEEEAL